MKIISLEFNITNESSGVIGLFQELLDELNSGAYQLNGIERAGLDKYKGAYNLEEITPRILNPDEFCFQTTANGDCFLVRNVNGTIKKVQFS